MVFKFEIFNHSEFRIHKTHIFSKATVFNVLILFFTFLLPFLLINASRDFWISEVHQFQIPNVTFLNQVILEVFFQNSSKSWSTVSSYKTKYINNDNFLNCNMSFVAVKTFRNSLVLGETIDEGLNLNIFVRTSQNNVIGVHALVVLDYKLQDTFMFQTQALASFERFYSVPGQQLIAYSRLKLIQKYPLPFGSHYNYSANILTTNSADDPYLVMKNYMRRNFTVILDQDTSMFSWTPATTSPAFFNLFLRIRYAPQSVRYLSSFWYSLKFAWLQYLSIMFIFYLFFDRVRFYVFSKRLVATTIIHPVPSKTTVDFM